MSVCLFVTTIDCTILQYAKLAIFNGVFSHLYALNMFSVSGILLCHISFDFFKYNQSEIYLYSKFKILYIIFLYMYFVSEKFMKVTLYLVSHIFIATRKS